MQASHPSDSRASSPDPLALSYDDKDTQHPMSSPRRNSPLRETSPNKRGPARNPRAARANESARRQTKSFKLSTPTRPREESASKRSTQTFRLNTPTDLSGRQSTSPLKIRVTVETEQDQDLSDNLGQQSPSRITTRTRKVPLKDVGGNPPKRRGRPRKSEAHLLLPSSPLSDDATPSPGKKGRNRPRKSDAGNTPLVAASRSIVVSPPPAKTRTMAPLDFAAVTPLHKKPENSHLAQTPSLSALRPSQSDSRAIRDRVPTPRKPPGWQPPRDETTTDESSFHETQSSRIGVDEDMSLPQFDGPYDDFLEPELAQYLAGAAAPVQPDTPPEDPNLLVDGWDASFPDDSSLKDVETGLGGDAALDMLDDTVALNRSAVESEGFSMVSIETLRQQHELAERQAMQSQQVAMNRAASQESHRRPAPTRFDRTPLQVAETSPSPPRLLSSPLKQSPSRKISSAVRAGSVLQEALSNAAHEGDSSNGNLFSGFGDGTQKQMRRSIAMGELLSRSDPDFRNEARPLSPRPYALAHETVPSVGRLPTPDDSLTSTNGTTSAQQADALQTEDQTAAADNQRYDDMSWRYDTLPRQQPVSPEQRLSGYDAMSWRPTTPPATNEDVSDEAHLSHTQRLELQHHREREEVIREARDANSSQVVMIDSSIAAPQRTSRTSDMLAEAPTQLEDLFLEEADRSLEDSLNSQAQRREPRSAPAYKPPRDDSSVNTRNPESLMRALPQHTPDFNDLLGPDERPMRGKLPRTWRRTTGGNLLYSDESGATPEKAGQPVQRPVEKRGGAALASPNKDDDVPTVFKRFCPSPTENEADHARLRGGPSDLRPRGILNSLSQRSSPAFQSSPPKEVRFAQDDGRNGSRDKPVADEDYYSSDEEMSVDEISNDDEEDDASNDYAAEATFIAGDDERMRIHEDRSAVLDHSRLSATTNFSNSRFETSDMRQIQRELQENSTLDLSTSDMRQLHREISDDKERTTLFKDQDEAKASKAPINFAKLGPTAEAPINLSPRKDRNRNSLFDPTPVVAAQPSASGTQANFMSPRTQGANASGAGILARAASWLWPPSYLATSSAPAPARSSAKAPSASRVQTKDLHWNQNHYILLSHYQCLACGIPSRGPALPAAFHDTPIPDKALRAYIGQEFTTTPRCGPHCQPGCSFRISSRAGNHDKQGKPKSYAAKFTELDARVAWAFMSEVLTRGVPLIRGEDGSARSGIVRDPRTGKVKRNRERWSAEEVALSVFSIGIVGSIEADL